MFFALSLMGASYIMVGARNVKRDQRRLMMSGAFSRRQRFKMAIFYQVRISGFPTR